MLLSMLEVCIHEVDEVLQGILELDEMDGVMAGQLHEMVFLEIEAVEPVAEDK